MRKKRVTVGEFLEREYKICFDYIKESKNYIYFAIGLFFLFALIGFFVPLPEALGNQVLNYFKNLLAQTQGLSWSGLIVFLFDNNSLAGFTGLFFGFLFGLFPLFSTIANGFILGFVSSVSVSKEGILSLWKLFPHGIFELPAILISFGLGLKFSTFILEKKKWEKFKEFLIKSISVYIFIVLPLLVIAAIIEGTLIYFGI